MSYCNIPTFGFTIPAIPALPAFPSFPPAYGITIAFTMPACPLD